jgi:hypothetical protein
VEPSIYGGSWYADRSAYAVEHNNVKTGINFLIFLLHAAEGAALFAIGYHYDLITPRRAP